MKINFYLAKNALAHFFKYNYWTNEELNSLQHFFSLSDSDRMWKLKLRCLCQENNDMIVAAVLADALPEEQIFLYDKFRLDYSFVKIGMELHVHPNGLQRWRDKFLLEISSLMNYYIPVNSIFSKNKVEVMVFALERIISFLETYGRYEVRFLDGLKTKLAGYQDLLFIIRQFLNSNSESVGVKIIRAKIINPNSSLEELTSSLKVSHTTVNKYLQYFQQKFYPFTNSTRCSIK